MIFRVHVKQKHMCLLSIHEEMTNPILKISES